MAKVEDSFYEGLDKGRYYLPPEGKYTGPIAEKNGIPFVNGNVQYGLVRFGLVISDGDEQGHWVWGTLNTKSLETVPEENIEAAKVGYGVAHRTLAAIGKALKQDFGLKDKKDWTTAELTEYVAGVLTNSADGCVFDFTVKHRRKDEQPVLDNRGNPRYDVYINKASVGEIPF